MPPEAPARAPEQARAETAAPCLPCLKLRQAPEQARAETAAPCLPCLKLRQAPSPALSLGGGPWLGAWAGPTPRAGTMFVHPTRGSSENGPCCRGFGRSPEPTARVRFSAAEGTRPWSRLGADPFAGCRPVRPVSRGRRARRPRRSRRRVRSPLASSLVADYNLLIAT